MLYFLFLLHQLLITTSVNLYQDVLCSDPMLNNWVIHFTICTFLWLVLVLLLPHIWKTKFCRFTSRMSLNDGNYTGEYFGISFLTYSNVHCAVYCILISFMNTFIIYFNFLTDLLIVDWKGILLVKIYTFGWLLSWTVVFCPMPVYICGVLWCCMGWELY